MGAYKISVIFMLLLISFSSKLKPENLNNIIHKDILNLSPNLNLSYVSKLSEVINKYSNKYSIDHKIVVAIFKVESNFDMKAVNYKSRDYGIGQINAMNMIHYKFDLGRHMTDLDYAVGNTYKILDYTKRKYLKEVNWFTRYHSYTDKYRKAYYNELKPYLERIGYGEAK